MFVGNRKFSERVNGSGRLEIRQKIFRLGGFFREINGGSKHFFFCKRCVDQRVWVTKRDFLILYKAMKY